MAPHMHCEPPPLPRPNQGPFQHQQHSCQGRLLSQLWPVQLQSKECCVRTLGRDNGQSLSWLYRMYRWWQLLCLSPSTFHRGKQQCIQTLAENQSAIWMRAFWTSLHVLTQCFPPCHLHIVTIWALVWCLRTESLQLQSPPEFRGREVI